MKPEEQLDSILTYLDNIDNRLIYVSIDHIYKDSKTTLDFKTVDMIVEKLRNDRYVSEKTESALGIEPAYQVYRITFHGKLFLSRGGYKQQIIDEREAADSLAAQNRRTERNEERLVLWTRNLFWGTVAVAIGAIGLIVWEIWQYFYSFCCY